MKLVEWSGAHRRSRRRFLQQIGVFCLASPLLPRLHAATSGPLLLTAAETRASLDNNHEATVWSYNGSIPGPLLRYRQGDEISIQVQNRLTQPTTVHWHGIRIDNAMDGVVGLTQEAIAPGADFTYRFRLPDAGTYWYHAHFSSSEQIDRGLAGLLIVEEPERYPADSELLLVLDDWRLRQDGEIADDFGRMHDMSHAGRLGNYLTINGRIHPELPVQNGHRVRLRLANVANARVMPLEFQDLDATVIALDGQPVSPYELPDRRITLAPGQRADLVLDVQGEPGERHAINYVLRDRVVDIAYLVYAGDRTLSGHAGPVVALPSNPLDRNLDLANVLDTTLHMEGGAMGGMREAVFKGQTLSMRELVRNGMVWAFNGVAGQPIEPFFQARMGQTVAVDMFNDTGWPHAMHMHGHHFRVIERNGETVANSPWRDTLLMESQERARIAFVADNPGKWLLHCHMLEHQMSGMVTWFEVAPS